MLKSLFFPLLAAIFVNVFAGNHENEILYNAIASRNTDSVRIALALGADANAPNKKGLTPLMQAIDQKDYKSCKLLLDSGADALKRNKNSENAHEYAIRKTAYSCLDIINSPQKSDKIASWEEQYTLILDHVNSGNQEAAKVSLEKLIYFSERNLNEETLHIYSIYLYANLLVDMELENQKFFDQALSLCEQLIGKENMIFFTIEYLKIKAQEDNNDFELNHNRYSKNLDQIESVYGKQSLEYIKYLDKLAEYCFNNSHTDLSIELYKERAEITKEMYTTISEEYTSTVNSLGYLYNSLDLYGEAGKCFLELYPITKEYFEEQAIHGAVCHNVGHIYSSIGEYKKAIPFYEEAISVTAWPNSTSFKGLAIVYMDIGQNEEALHYFKQSLAANKEEFGEKSLPYLKVYVAISLLYGKMGQMQKSLERFESIRNTYLEVAGENSVAYAQFLNNYGTQLFRNGSVKETLKYLEQAKEIEEQIYGDGSLKLAATYTNLGVAYGGAHDNSKALTYALKSLQIQEGYYDKPHESVANALNNVSMAYVHLGDYKKAMNYLTRSTEMYEITLGPEHESTVNVQLNLAALYSDLGNYQSSEKLLKEVEFIVLLHHGKQSPIYMELLTSLSAHYANIGEYEKAKTITEEYFQLYQTMYSEHGTEYYTMQSNLSEINAKLGNTFAGLQNKKKHLAKYQEVFTEPTNNLAAMHASLGSDYANLKRYYKASYHLNQAIAIYSEINGPAYHKLADVYTELAVVNQNQRKYDQVVDPLRKTMEIERTHLATNFMFLSEKELQSFIDFKYKQTHENLMFHFYGTIEGKYADELNEVRCNSLIFYKGLTLFRSNLLNKYVQTEADISFKNHYYELLEARKKIARFEDSDLLTKHTIDSLHEVTSRLESQLFSQMPEYAEDHDLLVTEFEDIRKNLSADQVAIELGIIDAHVDSRTVQKYVAFVILSNKAYPIKVELCETKQIERILEGINRERNFTRKQEFINKAYNQQLYDLLWQAIEPEISGKRKVYLSPFGLLNQVNFGAIRDNSNRILAEKIQLTHVFSTKVLALKDSDHVLSKTDNIGLWGGIDYSAPVTKISVNQTKSNNPFAPPEKVLASRRDIAKVNYLPGTLTEVNFISDIFANQIAGITKYTGASASEFSFKALSGNPPEFIHIATHGFYTGARSAKTVETGKVQFARNADVTSSKIDPMDDSGLLFSGFETLKTHSSINHFGDGMLTAREINNMDLKGNKLTVLSACETGLGAVQGAEGIFGLQRAFKVAGSDYILSSLWSIPDKETAEMMNLFYSNLKEGKDIEDSFTQAQLSMKKKYETYYWAGFVLKR